MQFKNNELIKNSFSLNGYQQISVDNLKHIYVRKYISKSTDGNSTATTNLIEIRDENSKYSHFLCNLILEHYYINHMSFEEFPSY